MTESVRALRSDGVRNRELLLAAGESEFAEKGLDASVADITARAGVGKGTFFRHFPTKDDLVAAIVIKHVGELDVLGQRLTAATDAGDALLEFLTIAADQRQQGDVEFLIRGAMSDPSLDQLRERFFGTVTALVTRAQDAGSIRTDITATDVISLMCAPSHIVKSLPGASPDLWKRYLALIFDGLRPAGASPLP